MPSFRRDHRYHSDLQESAERIYNLLEAEVLVGKGRRHSAKCANGCQCGIATDRAEAGRLANVAGLAGPTQQADTEIAHLTPGEIVVPLHAQTPSVMAALAEALGESLPRYVAGSRLAQRNPVSGYPAFASPLPEEYDWALYPMGWIGAAGRQIAGVPAEIVGGVRDFRRNYEDMKRANWKGADRYFHCMANYQAASRGSIGRATASALSEVRELYGQLKGDPLTDMRADQAANRYGRDAAASGVFNDARSACARFRPSSLPSEY